MTKVFARTSFVFSLFVLKLHRCPPGRKFTLGALVVHRVERVALRARIAQYALVAVHARLLRHVRPLHFHHSGGDRDGATRIFAFGAPI